MYLQRPPDERLLWFGVLSTQPRLIKCCVLKAVNKVQMMFEVNLMFDLHRLSLMLDTLLAGGDIRKIIISSSPWKGEKTPLRVVWLAVEPIEANSSNYYVHWHFRLTAIWGRFSRIWEFIFNRLEEHPVIVEKFWKIPFTGFKTIWMFESIFIWKAFRCKLRIYRVKE